MIFYVSNLRIKLKTARNCSKEPFLCLESGGREMQEILVPLIQKKKKQKKIKGELAGVSILSANKYFQGLHPVGTIAECDHRSKSVVQRAVTKIEIIPNVWKQTFCWLK